MGKNRDPVGDSLPKASVSRTLEGVAGVNGANGSVVTQQVVTSVPSLPCQVLRARSRDKEYALSSGRAEHGWNLDSG